MSCPIVPVGRKVDGAVKKIKEIKNGEKRLERAVKMSTHHRQTVIILLYCIGNNILLYVCTCLKFTRKLYYSNDLHNQE